MAGFRVERESRQIGAQDAQGGSCFRAAADARLQCVTKAAASVVF